MTSIYIPYIILFLTASVFSRLMFELFNDLEGPNLLIVGVVTLIVFLMSLGFNYFHSSSFSVVGKVRIIAAIVFQFIVVSIAYLFLN